MSMSMKRTHIANIISTRHKTPVRRILLILTLCVSLLFAACSSSEDSDTRSESPYYNPSASGNTDITPAETDLSQEERIELAKKILFTAYSGMENTTSSPLYNVMISDLNELAVTLALKAFQPQSLLDMLQREDIDGTLQDLMGTIGNDELFSQLEIFMSYFQKENIITMIETLINNFREIITAIKERRITDISSIINSSIELVSIINLNDLSALLDNEILADTIQESISTIINKLIFRDLNVEDLIFNIEDAIAAIRSQIVLGTMDNGLLDLFSGIILQWMVEDQNIITYDAEGVTTTITMAGLDSLMSGEGGEVTLTLSADFNADGFTLKSSPCTYTGNDDGAPDFEAVIVISVSNTHPMIDIQSVEVTAYDTLHASYPTHEVQYEDWTVSYAIDCATLLNVSLVPLVENMIQYAENYKDNRDYTVAGGFSLNGETYEITEMHFIQKEQDDGTSHLSIGGSILADFMGTGISVDVSSDMIKCTGDGLWVDSQLDVMIDQDLVNIVFDWNGSATIEGETISFWQEILNPLS